MREHPCSFNRVRQPSLPTIVQYLHFIMSLQKPCILEHPHKQCNKVLFSSKHLKQTSGLVADIWWSMTGVIYILISHLYWSSQNLVFTVCFCTLKQTSYNSIPLMSSCKSVFHAFSLSSVVSLLYAASRPYYLDTKPFVSMLTIIISSNCDRGVGYIICLFFDDI